MSTLTRRNLLIGSAATLVALSACGTDSESGARPQGGPWEFTDDRNKKATRDARPGRVVAQISAAAALWDFGVRPIGTFGEASGGSAVLRGNVDTSAVTWVGQTWGEFNVEKFASLNPDLLVAPMQEKDQLWYVPPGAASKIEALCPTVGVNYLEVPIDKVIDRYAELAGSLGADLNAAAVTAAKKDFASAAASLGAVAKAKPGLRVAFASGSKENLYFANPAMFSDLRYLKNQGVDLLTPDFDPKEPHWEVLSWEQAGKYKVDVVLYDTRNPSFFTTDLAKYPTLAKLPAVQAKQVLPWNPETPTSWAAFAPALRDLAAKLSAFRPGVGG
jgi:iron complex transport system substrate-binding protein